MWYNEVLRGEGWGGGPLLCYCRVLPVVVRDVATRMSVIDWWLKRSSLSLAA